MLGGTTRLGEDDYKRPKLTYQDKLSDNDVAEKLKNYKKVTDIYKVPQGTHLRYFTIDEKGETKFRLGGLLYRTDGLPNYVVLTNGSKSWSVQTETSVFYQKLSDTDINNKIKKLEDKNRALKLLVKEYKKKLEKYTKT